MPPQGRPVRRTLVDLSAPPKFNPKLERSKDKYREDRIVEETDPHRLQQRQKQIDFGKKTLGYMNYLKTVTRSDRSIEDPHTPNINRKVSKRNWDGIVRAWRRMLHKYDPNGYDYVPSSSLDGCGDMEDEDDILNVANEEIARLQRCDSLPAHYDYDENDEDNPSSDGEEYQTDVESGEVEPSYRRRSKGQLFSSPSLMSASPSNSSMEMFDENANDGFDWTASPYKTDADTVPQSQPKISFTFGGFHKPVPNGDLAPSTPKSPSFVGKFPPGLGFEAERNPSLNSSFTSSSQVSSPAKFADLDSPSFSASRTSYYGSKRSTLSSQTPKFSFSFSHSPSSQPSTPYTAAGHSSTSMFGFTPMNSNSLNGYEEETSKSGFESEMLDSNTCPAWPTTSSALTHSTSNLKNTFFEVPSNEDSSSCFIDIVGDTGNIPTNSPGSLDHHIQQQPLNSGIPMESPTYNIFSQPSRSISVPSDSSNPNRRSLSNSGNVQNNNNFSYGIQQGRNHSAFQHSNSNNIHNSNTWSVSPSSSSPSPLQQLLSSSDAIVASGSQNSPFSLTGSNSFAFKFAPIGSRDENRCNV